MVERNNRLTGHTQCTAKMINILQTKQWNWQIFFNSLKIPRLRMFSSIISEINNFTAINFSFSYKNFYILSPSLNTIDMSQVSVPCFFSWESCMSWSLPDAPTTHYHQPPPPTITFIGCCDHMTSDQPIIALSWLHVVFASLWNLI